MGYTEKTHIKDRLSWRVLFLCLVVIGECVVPVRGGAGKDVWKSRLEKESAEEESRPLTITFDKPARNWTDGVPIGNGRLGAMVWGGVASETLNLNEDTLWTGVPREYTNSSTQKVLAEVRKLVDDGKFAEATEAAVDLSGEPSDVYQLLGDIKIEFDDSHQNYTKGTYHRELDLDTATARVKYSVGDVEYTREHFASNPNQVIVTKISGSRPASLSFTVFLDSKLPHHLEVTSNNRIIMKGSCRSNRISPKFNPDGTRRILFEKLNMNEDPKGIQFAAILDIQISDGRGTIKVLDGKRLMVEGSDWAVLRLVASSSFAGPFTEPSESRRDPMTDSLNNLESIKDLSYSDLYACHLDDYQNLFHRVSLQLFKSFNSESPINYSHSKEINENTVSTANRVKSFQTDEDLTLVELLFQYGRYLLISSSRPGTQVSNLQGIWNKDVEPAWDGAPHLNINLQMNYWPSLSGNLKECQEPLFDYISSLSKTGSKTAKVNYGASGWVAHQVSDIWAKSSPDRGQAVWALWPMGGAWLCTHLWEHYTYTMDKDFLRNKAYPLLEGCTSFLLDWLVESTDGRLETNPSTSPEHTFIAPDGKQASVSYSATMDMEIIKEVFSEIVTAAQILGRSEDDIIKRVIQTQSRLPPPKIAADGSIMEWAEDFKDPEVHHRHISHLFALFPGHTINLEKTPELCKAAENTLIKRGDEGPGWSTTWKAACWARLRNSEHAYELIKHLIILVDPDHESNFEGGLYSNLFTAHPPFQIDANFGFSTAVTEMLLQSTMEDLYFLPALPQNKWPNGCVKGLKARGGLTVNICWKDGNLHEAGLWSVEQISFKRLHYRETTVMTNLSSGQVYTFDRQLKFVDKYPLDTNSH